MTTLLKVTVDNISAIAFYEANGFKIIGAEEGRKRMLHIMELNIQQGIRRNEKV